MPLTSITNSATPTSYAGHSVRAQAQGSTTTASRHELDRSGRPGANRLCERLVHSHTALNNALASLEELAMQAGISSGTVSVRIFRSSPRLPKAGEHSGTVKDDLGNLLYVLLKAEADAADSGDESDLLPLIRHVAPALIDVATKGLLVDVFGESYPPPRTLDDMRGLLLKLEDFVIAAQAPSLEPATVANSGLRRIIAYDRDDEHPLQRQDAARMSRRSSSIW